MEHHFQCHPLHDEEFRQYFEMSDGELQRLGMRRMIVDSTPGFPCRVSLEDARIGEEVILLNYMHQKADSPYRSSGPIFVRRNAVQAAPAVDEIPRMMFHRLLSLRGYDSYGMMVDALVAGGDVLKEAIHRLLDNATIEYLHIHNAKPGCYNCNVTRVKNQQ